MKARLLVLTAAFAALPAAVAAQGVGYDDTPQIPGSPWKVHDKNRPNPPVVTPGGNFSEGAGVPSDAIVLFRSGGDLAAWTGRDDKAPWKVERDFFEVVPKSGSIRTRQEFPNFQLHLEFATPVKVEGASQGRGNSGVLIRDIYEVQVLDSYENPTYADGQAGALYGQTPPLQNASRPPGAWQTYDIIFENPRWDADGKLVKKAAVTVIHNGVVLHHRREFTGHTPHRANGNYDRPHPPTAWITLQDHDNRTRFRNLWVRPLGEYDAAAKK